MVECDKCKQRYNSFCENALENGMISMISEVLDAIVTSGIDCFCDSFK